MKRDKKHFAILRRNRVIGEYHRTAGSPYGILKQVERFVSIDDEILACEAELRHAQLTGDVAILDRLLDDALVFTSYDGTLARKHDDLSMHRSGRMRITRMDPTDRHMMHLGATSVVNVLMNAEAVIDGGP